VQANHLRHHFAPDAAQIRRVRVAAMAYPPVEAKQIGELPAKIQCEHERQTRPQVSKCPANEEADSHSREQSDRGKPPCLPGKSHLYRLSVRSAGQSVRAENLYPEPRTV
jgi:hypothetical protein